MKALLIIDVQNDFLPGGALEVKNGDKVIPVINSLCEKFDLVVATQDWHPSNHMSFASNHEDKEPFEIIQLKDMEQVLWPNHCVQGSGGADISEGIKIHPVKAIFRKGMDPEIDSYSGFYDNGHKKSTGLAGYLKSLNVSQVFVTGLAADVCVYFTLKDAVEEGFQTYLIQDATQALDEKDFVKKKEELEKIGVKIISSYDISVL